MPSGVYKRTEEYKKDLLKRIKPFQLKKGDKINLGRKASKSTKEKMSISQKRSYILNPERKQRLIGRKLSEEHKKKISESNKGKKGTCFWSGKKRPEISGEKCHFWKGGILSQNLKIRTSLEYKLWRTAVFERDNYTCVWCGVKSCKNKKVKLNADHIKPFALFPELRFAIDNGRTLCVDCHRKTDTYGLRIGFNKK